MEGLVNNKENRPTAAAVGEAVAYAKEFASKPSAPAGVTPTTVHDQATTMLEGQDVVNKVETVKGSVISSLASVETALNKEDASPAAKEQETAVGKMEEAVGKVSEVARPKVPVLEEGEEWGQPLVKQEAPLTPEEAARRKRFEAYILATVALYTPIFVLCKMAYWSPPRVLVTAVLSGLVLRRLYTAAEAGGLLEVPKIERKRVEVKKAQPPVVVKAAKETVVKGTVAPKEVSPREVGTGQAAGARARSEAEDRSTFQPIKSVEAPQARGAFKQQQQAPGMGTTAQQPSREGPAGAVSKDVLPTIQYRSREAAMRRFSSPTHPDTRSTSPSESDHSRDVPHRKKKSFRFSWPFSKKKGRASNLP